MTFLTGTPIDCTIHPGWNLIINQVGFYFFKVTFHFYIQDLWSPNSTLVIDGEVLGHEEVFNKTKGFLMIIIKSVISVLDSQLSLHKSLCKKILHRNEDFAICSLLPILSLPRSIGFGHNRKSFHKVFCFLPRSLKVNN